MRLQACLLSRTAVAAPVLLLGTGPAQVVKGCHWGPPGSAFLERSLGWLGSHRAPWPSPGLGAGNGDPGVLVCQPTFPLGAQSRVTVLLWSLVAHCQGTGICGCNCGRPWSWPSDGTHSGQLCGFPRGVVSGRPCLSSVPRVCRSHTGHFCERLPGAWRGKGLRHTRVSFVRMCLYKTPVLLRVWETGLDPSAPSSGLRSCSFTRRFRGAWLARSGELATLNLALWVPALCGAWSPLPNSRNFIKSSLNYSLSFFLSALFGEGVCDHAPDAQPGEDALGGGSCMCLAVTWLRSGKAGPSRGGAEEAERG